MARKSRRPTLRLIALITPSLNQSEFLRATVESVLTQSYEPLTYHVQDGGSTDGTPAPAIYGGGCAGAAKPTKGRPTGSIVDSRRSMAN